MKKFFYILIFCLSFKLYPAHPGSVGGQILKMGIDAKSVSMGEASAAGLFNNSNIIYSNPAGLSAINKKQFYITHMNRIVDLRYLNLSANIPLKNNSSFGIGIFSLYTKDTRRDGITGNKLGEFMNYNNILTLAYSRKFKKIYSGVELKIVSNKLDSYKSSNIALDIGVLYVFNQKIALGATLQNIRTDIYPIGEKETIPLNLKTGIYYKPFKKISFLFDLNFPEDTKPILNSGFEFNIKFLSLRAGYKYKFQKISLGGLNGLSVGFGISIKEYVIDYAFTPYGDIGNSTHRISIGISF